MTNESHIIPIIEQLSFFSGLTAGELEQLAAGARSVRVEKGAEVFKEGSAAKHGYFLISGMLVLSKRGVKDDPLSVALLGPDEALGLAAPLQDRCFPLSAVALCESLLLQIEQRTLKTAFDTIPQLKDRLLKIIGQRMCAVQDLVVKLAQGDSEMRVANALVLFAEKFAERSAEAQIVAATREQLAAIAGVRVETCIRITGQFETEKLLSFPGRGKVQILNYAGLRGRAGRQD